MRWLLAFIPSIALAGFPYHSGSLSAGTSPSQGGAAAALLTAQTCAQCVQGQPIYLEIGTLTSVLVSASIGYSAANTPPHPGNNSRLPLGSQITTATTLVYASDSKWLYSSDVLQVRGSTAALSAGNTGDVGFLTFKSGYDKMGNTGTECNGQTTSNGCLALNANYTTQTPGSIGLFSYDSGHIMNHSSQLFSIGNTAMSTFAASLSTNLGITPNISYSAPDYAGDADGTVAQYVQFLKGIMNGSLVMSTGLTQNAVCTENGADYTGLSPAPLNLNGSHICSAVFSPFSPYKMAYGYGHWIEEDPAAFGFYSSPGAYGVYCGIDPTLTYYMCVVRNQPPQSWTNNTFITQQGLYSMQIAWTIWKAFTTGQVQP